MGELKPQCNTVNRISERTPKKCTFDTECAPDCKHCPKDREETILKGKALLNWKRKYPGRDPFLGPPAVKNAATQCTWRGERTLADVQKEDEMRRKKFNEEKRKKHEDKLKKEQEAAAEKQEKAEKKAAKKAKKEEEKAAKKAEKASKKEVQAAKKKKKDEIQSNSDSSAITEAAGACASNVISSNLNGKEEEDEDDTPSRLESRLSGSDTPLSENGCRVKTHKEEARLKKEQDKAAKT